MKVGVHPDDTATRIVVEADLTVADVAELKRIVLEHLAGARGLRIDLSRLQSCDTAGAQLVLALRGLGAADVELVSSDAVATALAAIGAPEEVAP